MQKVEPLYHICLLTVIRIATTCLPGTGEDIDFEVGELRYFFRVAFEVSALRLKSRHFIFSLDNSIEEIF
jgi:hypothetical protein